MVEGVGFEPTKPKQQIYSLPPLTTREPLPKRKHVFFHAASHKSREMREEKAGGRPRTNDLLITSQLLYQLSYASDKRHSNGSWKVIQDAWITIYGLSFRAYLVW